MGLKETPRKVLWEVFGATLGSLGTHLESFSDRLELILGSFGDLLGSFGDHLGVTFSIFRNSVLEPKL